MALKHQGCDLRFGQRVSELKAFTVEQELFDEVVDCRGIGARADLRDLRAVRGEMIWVESRETEPLLSRPVRLLHPRYPLYVIPRPGRLYGIGATSIEADDLSAVSVRSALELLSAAYVLLPALAEARIVTMEAGLRPVFPSHSPRIMREKGFTRINGLYRHGYLIGPALAERACAIITAQQETAHELADQW